MPATTTAPGLADRPLYDHAKLRAWREDAGLTLTEAAHRIGISYPWLTRIEHGNYYGRCPSLPMLHRLANAYGHQAAELLTGIAPSAADLAGAR